MKLTSIEPTPSPHSMKLNLNESLLDSVSKNYKQVEDTKDAPFYIKELFKIEGVKGLYHVADFIALERNPRVAWEEILPKVKAVFGITDSEIQREEDDISSNSMDDSFGEIKVFIQMFRGIPMQVKLDDGQEEKRVDLPELYMNAVMKASEASPNFVMERKWVEQKPRYGSFEEVGEAVVEELSASYDPDRIENLINLALENKTEERANKDKKNISLEILDDPNWKIRYAALDRLGEPTFEDLPFLEKALSDEKASIRRLATAYLGMIEEPEILPYLYKALKDKAVTVRRTAGDCLSDLGFKEAIHEMIKSLKDPNRLVRWRAAMFLYEVGDKSAVEALREAENDPEFEVRMQVKMALERIEGGEEAKGSVWHQMTQATKK